MTGDRLKQLTIAFGVLVVLWGLAELLRGGFDEQTGDFRIPVVTRDEADSVIIERAADTIVLRPGADTTWTVNHYRASAGAIVDFFKAFEDIPAGQLIAQSAATHARMEIDDSTARTLRVFGGGGVLVHLLAGKQGRSFQDTYYRLPGEDAVYSVRSRLTAQINKRLDDWRDREIAAIAEDSVGSAEIVIAGRRVSLTRGDEGWTLGGGEPADSAAVASFLRQYRTVSATGFPTDLQLRDSVQLAAPDRRAVLRDLAGEVLVDLAFDSTAGAFWVQRAGDTTVFRVARFTVDRLTPTDSVLRGR